jgi:hypothetical protein
VFHASSWLFDNMRGVHSTLTCSHNGMAKL